MALGNLFGRARVSRANPSAAAICDDCGFCYNLNDLRSQFQWGGATLINLGYLKCARCLDRPQDQYRSPILPADPMPRTNPRPDYWSTPPAPALTPGNSGFQQYVLTQTIPVPSGIVGAGIGAFIIGQSAIAGGASTPTPALYPTDKTSALASIAAQTGIPQPAGLIDRSITIAAQNVTQSLLSANPARAYLLLYSPAQPLSYVSTGTALLGATTNVVLGPGLALFAATASGLGTVYQGAMTAISLQAGNPVWAWEG